MIFRDKFVKLITLMILTLFPASIFADDTYVEFESGTARLMETHPSISMTEEYVLIEMMPDKYKVTAKFNFYNSGESTSVLVGFPIEGNRVKNGQDFTYFKTWVNNDLKIVKNIKGDSIKHIPKYRGFKVKTVWFPSFSTTTSIVEYAAGYGSVALGPMMVGYDYSTGGSWKGPIGKAIFDIRFSEELLGLEITLEEKTKYSLIHRSYGQMVFEIKDIEPQLYAKFTIWFYPLSFCTIRPKYFPGSRLCDYFLGKYICKKVKNYQFFSNVAAYPTLTVLRLRRNAIFAFHGRPFKDKILRDFFSFRKWYSPQDNFKESSLSKEELEYIKEIQKLEKSIKSNKPYPVPFNIPKSSK